MNAFTKYIELVTYFEELPLCLDDLASVVVGSDEASLDLQNSRIKYPHMRVDTPELRFMNDDNNAVIRHRFRCFVMTNEPKKTNAEENIRLSEMQTLCTKIIAQVYRDADLGAFDLILGDKESEPIRAWSGDNAFGWWFYLTIDLFTDECCD